MPERRGANLRLLAVSSAPSVCSCLFAHPGKVRENDPWQPHRELDRSTYAFAPQTRWKITTFRRHPGLPCNNIHKRPDLGIDQQVWLHVSLSNSGFNFFHYGSLVRVQRWKLRIVLWLKRKGGLKKKNSMKRHIDIRHHWDLERYSSLGLFEAMKYWVW